jgi:hypothetical protein
LSASTRFRLVLAFLAALVLAGSLVALRASSRDASSAGSRHLDRIIEVVLTGSRADVLALLEMHETPCTTALGIGGPPQCWLVAPTPSPDQPKVFPPPGTPPEGTPIKAFPISTCELEWRTDLDQVVDKLLEGTRELFAVIALEGPPFGAEYLPEPSYGFDL